MRLGASSLEDMNLIESAS
ncbi:hypothetical protein VULLAG_LOCUS5003 [Vulpes lagopus]